MPDGRSFLIDARGDASARPITLTLNWTAGLTPVPSSPEVERDATEVARSGTR
jgi:hypothetical protein